MLGMMLLEFSLGATCMEALRCLFRLHEMMMMTWKLYLEFAPQKNCLLVCLLRLLTKSRGLLDVKPFWKGTLRKPGAVRRCFVLVNPAGRPLEAAPLYAGNQAGLEATQMDDDLDQAQAQTQAGPFPSSPANPSWVQALLMGMSSLNQKQVQALLTGMSCLNQKQDSLRSTFG